MKMHHVPAPGEAAASQLWVMLPGAYMAPADFVAAGFVDALHRRGLPHDVALLEANVAEVADGSALLFLQQFLCDAAAGATSTRPITLLGISLGAHLALACLASTPRTEAAALAAARVHTACLLAPYLGPRAIAAEVAAAGGLNLWQPAPLQHDDMDFTIWRWLQQYRNTPPLYLGYGSEDRFAKAHALAAEALPAQQVDVVPGGHVWPVWTALWNRYLDQLYVT